MEGDTIQLNDIFIYKQKVLILMARWLLPEATGQVPTFYEGLRARGISVDMSIFG